MKIISLSDNEINSTNRHCSQNTGLLPLRYVAKTVTSVLHKGVEQNEHSAFSHQGN